MGLLKQACLGAAGAALLAGCVPDLDDELSLVLEPQVLAVVADPPEAGEGDRVTLSALVAGGGAPAGVDYAFCLTRKPLSELGPVDPSCLDASGEMVPLGAGARVGASLDREACSLFGPRRPTPEPGQPAGRPVDPDPTGGFYQPVLATLPGQPAVLGGVRLDCGLPGAERQQVIEYNQRHRPNQNPSLERVELQRAGAWQELPLLGSVTLAPGERIVLRASWPSCEADAACGGAETYVRLDPETRSLADASEELVASWYGSAGSFDEHRSAAPDAASNYAENTWEAPQVTGPVQLWVVVRDGRGGVGFSARSVLVQ